MQTFLPYPSYDRSAASLDNKRLGKQRVETLQIMTALMSGRGWIHHPAVKMWSGYSWSLLVYQEAICNEWVARGFVDTCLTKTFYVRDKFMGFDGTEADENEPFWLGNEAFHLSHQSNLIRKNPHYYGPQFPGVPDDLPYVWPV